MAEQKLEWKKTPTGHRAEWQGWVFEITTEDGGVFCFELNGVGISCEMSRHTLMDEAQVLARAIAAKDVMTHPHTGVWMPCHVAMPKKGEMIEAGYLGKDGEIVATSKFMVKETWPEVVFFEGGGFLAARGFWRTAQ